MSLSSYKLTIAFVWLNNIHSPWHVGSYVVDNVLPVSGVYHQTLHITVEDVSLYVHALYSRDPSRVHSSFVSDVPHQEVSVLILVGITRTYIHTSLR